LLKYVPKRQEFDGDQMDARTTLAVIDHNLSQNQGQRLTHKDKAFIKRPTQKERENGLPNQFIIKSLTSVTHYDENVCPAERRDALFHPFFCPCHFWGYWLMCTCCYHFTFKSVLIYNMMNYGDKTLL
jgi:hypothetical protein